MFLTGNQIAYYKYNLLVYYKRIVAHFDLLVARIDLALTPYELRPNMTKEELKRLNKI